MISIERELGDEISKAVGKIVAASHTAAIKALDQAFDRGRGAGCTSRASGRPKAPRVVAVSRRSSEEIVVLKQRLYEIVCEMPGEAMAVLAKQIESTPGELQVPIARLKAEGLLKTVGQRQAMRYFPLGQ